MRSLHDILRSPPPPPVPSGFVDLDLMAYGCVTVLASACGEGAFELADQIAARVARSSTRPVLVFTNGRTGHQLAQDLCRRREVDVGDAAWHQRLMVEDRLQPKVADVRERLISTGVDGRFAPLCVVQRVGHAQPCDAFDTRAGEMVAMLAPVARAFDSAILLTLGPSCSRPFTVDDLDRSGAVVDAADIVALLHRPGYWEAGAEPATEADVLIVKHPVMTTQATLRWDHGSRAFEDYQLR